jgi:hypothetical protein
MLPAAHPIRTHPHDLRNTHPCPKPSYYPPRYNLYQRASPMPIQKSDKIVWIIFPLILVVGLSQNACVQATWASHRIRNGMTLNEALEVSADWTWGHAYSERPAPEPGVGLSFNHRLIHFLGKDESQKFASLNEVALSLDQQMTGHPWRMSLTYVGMPRPSFAVSFDAQGKVQSVSAISLAD